MRESTDPAPPARRRLLIAALALASPAFAYPDLDARDPARRPGATAAKDAPPKPPPPVDSSTGWKSSVNAPVKRPPAAAESQEAAPPSEPVLAISPEPFFDDRPLDGEAPVVWEHKPSTSTLDRESANERAATDLLANPDLPDGAHAYVLGRRAQARLRLWRLADAALDIQAAIAFDDAAPDLRLTEVAILAAQGRTADAEAVLPSIFALDPDTTLAARAAGLVQFQSGDFSAAAASLAFHLGPVKRESLPPDDVTLPLLLTVARARAEPGSPLTVTASTEATAPWPAPIARMLAGTLEREDLLIAARAPNGAGIDEAACAVWFYLGQRALLQGNKDRAIRDLLACLRTGATSVPEYILAVADLVRLGTLAGASESGHHPDHQLRVEEHLQPDTDM